MIGDTEDDSNVNPLPPMFANLPPIHNNSLSLPSLNDDMMHLNTTHFDEHLLPPPLEMDNYDNKCTRSMDMASHFPSNLLTNTGSRNSSCPLSDSVVTITNITDKNAVHSHQPRVDSHSRPKMNVIYTKPASSSFTRFDSKISSSSSSSNVVDTRPNDELECKSESDHDQSDDDCAHSDGDQPYTPTKDLMERKRLRRLRRSKRSAKASKASKSSKKSKVNKSKSAKAPKSGDSIPLKSISNSAKRKKNGAIEGAKRKNSKPSKATKRSKNSKKKKSNGSLEVKPAPNGHGSIPWIDLCRTSFLCHFCDAVYTDENGGSTAYIECLKSHYNSDPTLEYLTCELCLVKPTKSNAKKKEECNGEGSGWRKCKHAANFISHLSGHSEAGLYPGYRCRVKMYDDETGVYVPCSTRSSTRQNLAKHVYNCHYKDGDVDEEFTVIPDHGYVDRVLAKELVKPGVRRKHNQKNKNQRGHSKPSKSVHQQHSGAKRLRSKQESDRVLRPRTAKRLKMDHVEAKDDEEVSLEAKSNSTSRDDTCSPYGVPPCRTLEEQIEFVDKMNRCGRYLLFKELLEE